MKKLLQNGLAERGKMMGVAILMVIFYHLIGATESKVFMPFYLGFMGVDIFLFLSGYGLCHAYSKYNILTFYKKRFYRIFPLYFLMAVFVSLIKITSGQEMSLFDWI